MNIRKGDELVQIRPEHYPDEGHHTPHQHSYHNITVPSIPDRKTLFDAGELMRALAAPVRIAIVILLNQPRCVHDIVEALNITQPLVSQHLRVLRSAGVVVGERTGREVMYRLADDHLVQIVRSAIEHVQE